MKKTFFTIFQFKTFLILCFTFFIATAGISQMDTLHLNFHHTQTKPHDTTVARIENWVKTLNNNKVDIKVIAYFHKPEFKKFAVQRNEEMFIVLNRKGRDFFKSQDYEARKGKDYQRTMVDILYTHIETPEEIKAKAEAAAIAAAKAKEEEAAKAAKKEAVAKKEEKAKKEEAAESKDKGKKDVAKSDKEGEGKNANKEGEEIDKKNERGNDGDNGDYGQSSTVKYGEGGALTLNEVKYIKGAKFIVAQGGNAEVDDNLLRAAREFFDFNKNIIQMPYEEARKMGKTNKKDSIVILSFVKVSTWFEQGSVPGYKIKMRYIGYAVSLENGKGKTLVTQFINKPNEKLPTLTSLCFATSLLNDVCKTMVENNLSKSSKLDELYDLRTPELKNKKLLVPEHLLNPKLPIADIPKYYTSDMSLVSPKEWEEAILNKKDVAYVVIAMLPRPPKGFSYYIMDAKTGRLLYVDYGPKFDVSMGWGTASMNASQSGFVDKANFERFEAGVNKAIKDNSERAEDKAKAAEKEKQKAAKKEKTDEKKEEKPAKAKKEK